MVAIDTNIVIAQQNKRLTEAQKQVLAQAGDIGLPCVVAGELLFGAHNSGRAAENIARYRQVIASFAALTLDSVAAEHYARIRWELKQKGQPIPENDMWIAAICLANDLPLATLDAHFAKIAGLRLLPL